MRLLALCLVAAMPLAAQQIQTLDDGPVHEALVTSVTGSVVLDVVAQKPPEPVLEKQPSQSDEDAQWVAGYWDWSEERDDYVWATGVWRRPPPGHVWIAGFWKMFDDGWVRIPGFWSPVAAGDLTYIEKRPPDPLDENVQAPSDDDSFWIPGHWSHNASNNTFSWLAGRWEHLDPDWVFVPSRYTWRPDGYVFVPGHWDWPIEQVGQAYDAIYVEPSARVNVSYEPTQPLQPGVIIQRLFVSYPNYLCYYQHHHYYHVGWWSGWCCTPPWWSWSSWWSFSWSNQWGLWWWWGHPGYPQPRWLTANYARRIGPPGPQLKTRLKRRRPPAIVTRRGLVPANKLTGKRPFLPANPKERAKIIDGAKVRRPGEILRPEGTSRVPGQLNRPVTLPPGERSPRGAGRVDKPPRAPTKQMRPARPPVRQPADAQRRPRPTPGGEPPAGRRRPLTAPESQPRTPPQTAPRQAPRSAPSSAPRSGGRSGGRQAR